jgi:hypothetical protein
MMANAPIVLRGNPEDFLEITSVERFSDSSSYSSLLSVGAGRFSCLRHPFYFDDLESFTTALAKAYDRVEGKARLAHKYEKDVIEIEVFRAGQVSVEGFILENGPPHQELRFAFCCDQTFLPDWLHSLKQVAAELEDKS